MKITIKSEKVTDHKTLINLAMQAYICCQNGVNKDKNVNITFDDETCGTVTQQGKVICFMNKGCC